jgi:selenocysteine-specific translation elongation factor
MDAPTHFILFKRIDFYYLPFDDKAVVFGFVAASGFENKISSILESVKLPVAR